MTLGLHKLTGLACCNFRKRFWHLDFKFLTCLANMGELMLNVSIQEVELKKGLLGNHAEYVIEIDDAGEKSVLRRRYRDFFYLWKVLESAGLPLANFPPKQVFRTLDQNFLEERKIALSIFIADALANQAIQQTTSVWSFLNKDESIGKFVSLFSCEVGSIESRAYLSSIYEIAFESTQLRRILHNQFINTIFAFLEIEEHLPTLLRVVRLISHIAKNGPKFMDRFVCGICCLVGKLWYRRNMANGRDRRLLRILLEEGRTLCIQIAASDPEAVIKLLESGHQVRKLLLLLQDQNLVEMHAFFAVLIICMKPEKFKACFANEVNIGMSILTALYESESVHAKLACGLLLSQNVHFDESQETQEATSATLLYLPREIDQMISQHVNVQETDDLNILEFPVSDPPSPTTLSPCPSYVRHHSPVIWIKDKLSSPVAPKKLGLDVSSTAYKRPWTSGKNILDVNFVRYLTQQEFFLTQVKDGINTCVASIESQESTNNECVDLKQSVLFYLVWVYTTLWLERAESYRVHKKTPSRRNQRPERKLSSHSQNFCKTVNLQAKEGKISAFNRKASEEEFPVITRLFTNDSVPGSFNCADPYDVHLFSGKAEVTVEGSFLEDFNLNPNVQVCPEMLRILRRVVMLGSGKSGSLRESAVVASHFLVMLKKLPEGGALEEFDVTMTSHELLVESLQDRMRREKATLNREMHRFERDIDTANRTMVAVTFSESDLSGLVDANSSFENMKKSVVELLSQNEQNLKTAKYDMEAHILRCSNLHSSLAEEKNCLEEVYSRRKTVAELTNNLQTFEDSLAEAEKQAQGAVAEMIVTDGQVVRARDEYMEAMKLAESQKAGWITMKNLMVELPEKIESLEQQKKENDTELKKLEESYLNMTVELGDLHKEADRIEHDIDFLKSLADTEDSEMPVPEEVRRMVGMEECSMEDVKSWVKTQSADKEDVFLRIEKAFNEVKKIEINLEKEKILQHETKQELQNQRSYEDYLESSKEVYARWKELEKEASALEVNLQEKIEIWKNKESVSKEARTMANECRDKVRQAQNRLMVTMSLYKKSEAELTDKLLLKAEALQSVTSTFWKVCGDIIAVKKEPQNINRGMVKQEESRKAILSSVQAMREILGETERILKSVDSSDV
eukprot:GHVP01019033.1.p1 GENE.GHVP01019033.1~~GHVP01019033.1.p1  ORF type:complete len:1140 (+),score=222.20 GHVP01019033.1:969-4388(+)